MLFFKRKNPVSTDLSWLGTDFHSHLLPGIDDGSQDIETSLFLIRGLQELGYKKIITTPHIIWELYPNTPEKITTALHRLKAVMIKENIEVELNAAAEYFMDDHFEMEVRNKAILLPVSKRKILVEFSMLTPPMDFKKILFELQMQNYEPILAHPERYTYLEKKKDLYEDFKNFGCYFQMNLLSLTAHYGPTVQSLAEYLIKKGFYEYVGTDLHHARHLEALKRMGLPPMLKKLKESGKLKNQLL